MVVIFDTNKIFLYFRKTMEIHGKNLSFKKRKKKDEFKMFALTPSQSITMFAPLILSHLGSWKDNIQKPYFLATKRSSIG